MARSALDARLALLAGILAALLPACGGTPGLEEQRARLAAEHEERMRRLEEVEIRLLTIGARQRAWDDLHERHARISAIACTNVAEHVAAMEAHDEKQRQKRQQLRARRRAAAQAQLDSAPVEAIGPEARAASN